MPRTRKSKPLVHNKCKHGYVKRSGFTRKTNGKHIKGICVRGVSKKVEPKTNSSLCGHGKILRASYTRHMKTKNNQIKSVHVKASCISKPHPKSDEAPRIGPLKKGELGRFGYLYKLPESDRHLSMRRAIKELGPLHVYRMLDAVAKLTVRTSPKASETFARDRDWIRSKYVLS